VGRNVCWFLLLLKKGHDLIEPEPILAVSPLVLGYSAVNGQLRHLPNLSDLANSVTFLPISSSIPVSVMAMTWYIA
jgi:hypothetical protein